VKLLLCDVDGVLTDGTVWIGRDFEAKGFSILDGMGLALLRRAGLQVGWISSRPSPATAQRAAELSVDYLHQDKTSKVQAVESILARAGCGWEEVCFVGDDLVDLGALRRAGVAVAVANAVAEVKRCAHFTTRAGGGQGAVREVVEKLLRARGHWRKLVAEFDV
jgi:3-deoxy-D-manno-octulosonate 8-phosphate phosphatase (KDO 8-P phosphatase)